MRKTAIFNSLNIMCLIFLTAMIAGCQPRVSDQKGTGEDTSVGGKYVAGIALDVIEKADLHVAWVVSKLDLGRADHIKRIFYHNKQLYVLDNRNKLYALDGQKGILRWAVSLGGPRDFCSQEEFYQEHIIFAAGNSILELHQNNGRIVRRTPLKFTPNTSAVRSDEILFVGSDEKRFYAIRREDGVVLWQSAQPENPTGKAAVHKGNIYFTCKNGALYVSKAEKRESLWQVSTEGEVPGVVIDEGQCYLPSTDTSLYCFRADSGEPAWKYFAGGKLVELPVLTNRFAYQSVELASLLCLDRLPADNKGSLKWELKGGLCLLAENGPWSYVMTLNRELTVMDNLSGRETISFYVPGMDIYARNNEDAYIFLAGGDGSILALLPNRIATVETK